MGMIQQRMTAARWAARRLTHPGRAWLHAAAWPLSSSSHRAPRCARPCPPRRSASAAHRHRPRSATRSCWAGTTRSAPAAPRARRCRCLASPARSRLRAEPAVRPASPPAAGTPRTGAAGRASGGRGCIRVHRLGEPDGLARDLPAAEPGTAQMMAPAPAGQPGDAPAGPGRHPPAPGGARPGVGGRAALPAGQRVERLADQFPPARGMAQVEPQFGGTGDGLAGRPLELDVLLGVQRGGAPVRWPSSCRHRSGRRASPEAGCRLAEHPPALTRAGGVQGQRPHQSSEHVHATSDGYRRIRRLPPCLRICLRGGPSLHRPAASGATGAVITCGGVAAIGNLNMVLSLRDSYICEADITSCEALLQ